MLQTDLNRRAPAVALSRRCAKRVCYLVALVLGAWWAPLAQGMPSDPTGHRSQVAAGLLAALGDESNTAHACVVSLSDGALVFGHNASEPIKPASIQKLITTAAFFERFGPEAQFATEVYQIAAGKGRSTLYLRGLGDPMLTTESLWMLARAVRANGVGRVSELVFDDFFFDGAKARDGQRAYMGGASALAVNFNALEVKACPTIPGAAAKLTVEPFEAGWTAQGAVSTSLRGTGVLSVNERGGDRAALYVVSGKVSIEDGCQSVYRSAPDPAVVAAELFRKNLEYLGIAVPKAAHRGRVPSDAVRLEVGMSRPAHEVAWGMNHWSTNVVAEQLMMLLGADRAQQAPSDAALDARIERETAVAALNRFAQRIAGSSGKVTLVDGSGLSHENRAPTQLFCNVLYRLSQDPNVSVEFEHSLPVSGRSGTLRERDFDLPQGQVRAKTGTIDGVSSLSGYLVSRLGNKYAFAIVSNSGRSKPQAVQLEDRFVRALYNDSSR